MTDLVYIILVFVGVGVFFLFFHMMLGKMVRPSRPDSEKLTIYECGEPAVGSAWIQFDARYYVVALVFVIFDVEVAFFFPWAIVFGSVNEVARHPEWSETTKLSEADQKKKEAVMAQLQTGLPPIGNEDPMPMNADTAKSWAWVAFADVLVFFGVLLVGFAYLWRRGDIDWVRSTASEKIVGEKPEELPILRTGEVLVAGAR
jgi:NADH-quinone oxidoreductase subunit A